MPFFCEGEKKPVEPSVLERTRGSHPPGLRRSPPQARGGAWLRRATRVFLANKVFFSKASPLIYAHLFIAC